MTAQIIELSPLTSELSNLAFDAMCRKEYSAAASLYQQALDVFPSHHPRSSMAIAHKSKLQARVNICKQAASELTEVAA